MNARAALGGSFTRTKPIVLLTGLAMTALGIAVLINPIGAVDALVRISGWILVVYGVISLVLAFVRGDPVNNAKADLAISALALIFGLIMAFFSAGFVKFIWNIIGLFVFITGVLDVLEAGTFRRDGSPLALPATVSGIITALLGLAVLILPFFTVEIAMLLAAVALVVDGITEIIFGLSM